MSSTSLISETLDYQARLIRPPLHERIDLELWAAVSFAVIVLLIDVCCIVAFARFWN
jgi:hypothetical protein